MNVFTIIRLEYELHVDEEGPRIGRHVQGGYGGASDDVQISSQKIMIVSSIAIT